MVRLAPIDRAPDELKAALRDIIRDRADMVVRGGGPASEMDRPGASLNLYIAQPSGKKLDSLYREAWHAGLKTTYYLRSRSATHVEKSTLKRTDGKLNAVSLDAATPKACAINDPTCEACQ